MAEKPENLDPMERRGLSGLLASLLVETRSVMPAAGATGVSLVLVIAAMCFLASLTFGAALSVGRAADSWTSELAGALTVEIKPSPDMDKDSQLDAVMSVLAKTPGIKTARPLDQEDMRALLEPWLGQGNVTDDLPLPTLIAVEIDMQSPPDMAGLAFQIAASAPGALLDTHRQWQAQLLQAARTVAWLAYGVLAIVAATTIAIVTFATRAGLSANREVVEVLHLIGAKDRFIAREVQRHFLHLGLRGGLIGLALSALTFLAAGFSGQSESLFLVPVWGLPAELYPWLLLVPLAASLVAVLTARVTVFRTLEQML
ncbi:MAG: cell division protein [Rhizobiales bacterium]|nr:cell division protein [Hyphomicrobiales bacterium]